uniref:Uncharacterized protein n=1 Tax=Cucumis melo TaxID=3656 RepID=A0A9I9EBG4_CUCME
MRKKRKNKSGGGQVGILEKRNGIGFPLKLHSTFFSRLILKSFGVCGSQLLMSSQFFLQFKAKQQEVEFKFEGLRLRWFDQILTRLGYVKKFELIRIGQ